ncbi:MAG: hypothetical protein QXF10_08740 [Ignisphaera sp.]
MKISRKYYIIVTITLLLLFVNIVIPMEAIVMGTSPNATRQKYRPLIGGIQIGVVKWSWFIPIYKGYCTIGYSAMDRNGLLGVVTAGHCSNWDLPVSVYQPDLWEHIGGFSYVNKTCDLGFIPYSNSAAKILYIDIYNNSHIFDVNNIISWEYIDVWKNEIYNKTGRSTGTTDGYLVAASSDPGYDIICDSLGLKYCLFLTYYSEPGDSGAPVYELYPLPAKMEIRKLLLGHHWGRVTIDYGSYCIDLAVAISVKGAIEAGFIPLVTG